MSHILINDTNLKSIEPRIISNFIVSKQSSIKISYTIIHQYIHLLTSSSASLPADIWVPATKIATSSQAQQLAIGFYNLTQQKEYEMSIEIYLKRMNNLIEYKEGNTYQSASFDWEKKIETNGNGKSYGIEFLLQKRTGKNTGWIACTIAKTNRQFKNINNGEVYPFKYDRRLEINIVNTYNVTKNLFFSISGVFGSGLPYTLPIARYEVINDNSIPDETIYIWAERNSERMRTYHHIDISLQFKKEVKKGIRTWNFSIYNIYNRQNPYFYFTSMNENDEWKLYQQSLFPIIPSVSYSLKF